MTSGADRSLFAGRPERPRLGFLSGAVFPLAAEASCYAQLDELAADLGAELRAVHTVVPDPRSLTAPLRARLGSGLFVPQNPQLHRNDLAHCQRTLGARCERLLAALAGVTGMSPAELLRRPELHEAFSYARWIRAWGADLVWSHGLAEGSLPALVAAHLLELPRVVVLDNATFDSAWGQLLPLHVEQAQLVVAIGTHVHDALLARCGAAAAGKTVLVQPDAIAAPAVRAAVARALVMPRPASAPSRGPDAAFVAPRRTSSPPRAARP
ncbi:MAG: hypothetical protein MUC36_05495, partial [Planctomycetes bacterium]|nr:hypothetical protein [Planctomycetota bacterium]